MTFNSTAVVGDAFHRFTVVWNETAIVWYVDDVEFGRQLAANANSTQWVSKEL
jgi:beta-glucanase (GH16 family)